MAESSGSVVSNNVNTQKQSCAVKTTDGSEGNKTEKVMEPLLLEDFKYNDEPKSLSNLLEFFEKNKISPSKYDILAGLVYVLMLESGFVPMEQRNDYEDYNFNHQRVLTLSKQLPNNWKKGSLYSFSFILPPFQVYECSLACIPAADDILVNCVVKGVENGHYNTIIDPLTYFSSSSTCIRLNKLQNLNHLSRVVKDSVCYPAKQVILRNNGEIVDCLEQLPPEIVLFIMCYLNIKDLVRFGQTNSFFYKLMQTPKLWMRRIKIDLGNMCSDMHTYKELKDFYRKTWQQSRRSTRSQPPSWW